MVSAFTLETLPTEHVLQVCCCLGHSLHKLVLYPAVPGPPGRRRRSPFLRRSAREFLETSTRSVPCRIDEVTLIATGWWETTNRATLDTLTLSRAPSSAPNGDTISDNLRMYDNRYFGWRYVGRTSWNCISPYDATSERFAAILDCTVLKDTYDYCP